MKCLGIDFKIERPAIVCIFSSKVRQMISKIKIFCQNLPLDMVIFDHFGSRDGWSHSLSFLRHSITHFSSRSTIKLLIDYTSADICLIELKERELKIYHLQKTYKMKQKGGRLAGLAGLTICCYFPKHWMFELDETKYARVIPISSLHSNH